MHGVNFIPIDMQSDRRRRTRHRAAMSAWVFGLVALGAAWGYTHTLVPNPDLVALDGELNEVDDRLRERRNELSRLERGIRAAEQERDEQIPVVDQPDWSILLALIAAASGDAVVLSDFTLTAEPRENAPPVFRVQLHGWGRDQKSVSDFLMRLERSGAFDHIVMTESRRRDFHAAAAAKFTIAGAIGATEGE